MHIVYIVVAQLIHDCGCLCIVRVSGLWSECQQMMVFYFVTLRCRIRRHSAHDSLLVERLGERSSPGLTSQDLSSRWITQT